jgi:predicted neuraminidase
MLKLVVPTVLVIAAALTPAFGQQYEAEQIFALEGIHNHGSSIVECPNGDLLACWFHGHGERTADDVIVQGARKPAGASEWSERFLMADSQDLPDCNPVLFVDPRGTLWLFWIAVQSNEWGSSLLKYRVSTDYMQPGPPKWEWQDVIHCRPTNFEEVLRKTAEEYLNKSPYKEFLTASPEMAEQMRTALEERAADKLTRRLGWMTRLHPIMVSDTKMVLGLYTDVFSVSLVVVTEDWGNTWAFGEPIVGFGNIQPSLVRKNDGSLVAMMRENGIQRRIRISTSQDEGMTWSSVENMDIPNPGSSVECIRLANGNWVLVCNDTAVGRHSLSALLSDDEGATWQWKRHLELWKPGEGSASYPSVMQARDGSIHATYSYSPKGQGSCIKHAGFDEAWIRQGDPETP